MADAKPTVTKPATIDLVWWNANNFYHYDATRVTLDSQSRWPRSAQAYQEKCARVDRAMAAITSALGRPPSLLAIGETTAVAAHELRQRLYPTYRVCSLDADPKQPTGQIALLYQPNTRGLRFEERQPLIAGAVPRTTRPMAVLEIVLNRQRIRCVFCHWQARFAEEAENTRQRMADCLAQKTFDYVCNASADRRHIVIMGDFNDEPYGLPASVLHGHRHRERSRGRVHYSDEDTKRVHLYNCAWRMLGEKHPHAPKSVDIIHVAGTYYWAEKKSWHGFDQAIVSGGLLGGEPPSLAEAQCEVLALPEFLPEILPATFRWDGRAARGLSDHLPILVTLNLESQNDKN